MRSVTHRPCRHRHTAETAVIGGKAVTDQALKQAETQLPAGKGSLRAGYKVV